MQVGQLLNFFMYNHIKIYRVSKTLLKYILAKRMLDSMFIAIFRQVKIYFSNMYAR